MVPFEIEMDLVEGKHKIEIQKRRKFFGKGHKQTLIVTDEHGNVILKKTTTEPFEVVWEKN